MLKENGSRPERQKRDKNQRRQDLYENTLKNQSLDAFLAQDIENREYNCNRGDCNCTLRAPGRWGRTETEKKK